MEKNNTQKKRLCVEYKGGELILQPGHSVYELDLKSGIVTEYKLIEKFSWRYLFTGKKPKFRVDSSDENKIHLPAASLHKAKVAFKNFCKAEGIIVKVKD